MDTAHFVYDEANGSLTLLKMFDHDPKATLIQRSLTDKQWTTRAPMLALSNPGPDLALPEKTVLQPAILLRNASAKSYTAQLTFNWRSDTAKGKSTTSVSLRPHQTRLVDVAALQSNGTIPADAHWAYVGISAPINPDELLAVATSFDASGKFGAQTPFTDQVATHWEGGKWEVDANHNTLIAVGNAGTTASKTLVTFYYNSAQGKYEFEQTLGSDEQLWLDMGKLIGNQIPDRNGKTIPPDVVSGTYEIRNSTNKEGVGLFEGKLVVDKTFGHAVHGCGGCCAWAQAHTYFSPMNLAVDQGLYQQVWATETCTLQVEEVYLLQPVSWSTGNTSIATANNNAYIWGVAAGSTTQYGSGYLQSNVPPRSCPNSLRNVQAPTDVQMPDHLYVSNDTQQTVNCGGNPSSRTRQITYEVVDVNNNQMLAPFLLRENVPSNIVSTCTNTLVHTGTTCTVNTNYEPGALGKFTDVLSPGCPNSPNNSPCGFQFANQQWQWCNNTGPVSSIGTIGPVNAENTVINVDGNVTGFAVGTTFPK